MANPLAFSQASGLPAADPLAADFVYAGVTYHAGLARDDVRLLLDFNNAHGQHLNDPDVLRRILGSRHVKPWYDAWKAADSLEKSLPPHWAAANMTPAEWNAAQIAVRNRATARRNHAMAIEAAARAFAAARQAADQQLANALAATPSPMAQVIEAGYEQLSLADQLAIESAPPADRQRELDTRLAAARAVWVNLVQTGGALPF